MNYNESKALIVDGANGKRYTAWVTSEREARAKARQWITRNRTALSSAFVIDETKAIVTARDWKTITAETAGDALIAVLEVA